MACNKGSSAEVADVLQKGGNTPSLLMDKNDNTMYYVLLNNIIKKSNRSKRKERDKMV